MSQRAEAIAERCRETADAARDAAAWVAEPANADKVGDERPVLLRQLRQLVNKARRLEATALRPTCVSVYGPSQAGKSYLVSVLARPGTGGRPLLARFEGKEEDFVARINPEGGRESTGLVTRFTLQPVAHPPGFAVCLRLLSQADIVKILANTFFLDGDLTEEGEPTSDVVREVLAKARAAAATAPVDNLTVEDVWEIEDYCREQFLNVPYFRALSGLWGEAAELAPRLRPAERAELFSLLWGRHEPFTALYRTLLDALGQLGFATDAFCPLEPALIPRETSIIDVAMLAGLGHPGADTIPIRALNGPEIRLPRPLVTALTAELRIVCAERPWPFFDHTDLLDFPGARSRQPLPLKKYFAEKEDALAQTFLRGKVAYLFDRYVADQELNAMLLCIDEKNQEVITLPNMVDGWIGISHGKTPAERRGRPCVLFFVLTKFDMHFAQKAGEDKENYGARFKNRMHTSLLGFFGKAHDWPKEWVPGEPFNNCFWLRNPNYPADTIITYEEKREVAFREDRKGYIEDLRAAYIEVEEVNRHFRDPERAWDEALKLNDGGVSHLAAELAQACSPELKSGQLANLLEDLRKDARARLEPYYVPTDLEGRLEQRREVGNQVIDDLYRAADLGRFGHMLRALQVTSGELADVLYRAEIQPLALDGGAVVRVVSEPQRPTAERLRPGAPRPRPGGAAAAAPSETQRPPTVTLTREQMLATAAVRHWIQSLHQLRDNARACHRLELPPRSVAELVSELGQAAGRLRLSDEIAAAISRMHYIEKGTAVVEKPALLAATMINRFVDHLGFDRVEPAARPQVGSDGDALPVFAPRPILHDAAALGAEPEAYADRFLTDWAFAFYKLVEDNAAVLDGRQVDLAQNTRLAAILETLAHAV